MPVSIRAWILLAPLLVATTLRAAEITVVNPADVPVSLWLWKEGAKQWNAPIQFRPRQRAQVAFEEDGRYYAVARANGIETAREVLGWLNLRKLVERDPNVELQLTSKLESRTKTVNSTVPKLVMETQTREFDVLVPEIQNGRTVVHTEKRTRQVQITKMVPEPRTREVQYYVRTFMAVASVGDTPLLCNVTATTQSAGATVSLRPSGLLEVRTLGNPTTTSEPIPVGIYVVWSERDGKPTSQELRYDVFDEQLTITIPEDAVAP